MKIDDLVIELERQYPNSRFIHPINENGGMIKYFIKQYLKTGTNSNLWVAYEYIKTLNEKLQSHISLKDIDEISENNIISEIEDFSK